MRSKHFNTTALLLLFIVLEHLFLYFFFKNKVLSQGKNAISFFLSSVLFGVVLIYRFYNTETVLPVTGQQGKKGLFYPVLFLMVCGLIALGFAYHDVFAHHPLSLGTSDVIPCIQVTCKRLLAGKYAYDLIYDFGGPQWFPYLPLHWMPFTIAEIFHFDYRMLAYGAWCIAATWLCARNIKAKEPTFQLLAAALIFASNYILFVNSPTIVIASVELLISGYYIMLIIGLNQQNGIIQGFLISLCLLSRYSLVLWLPLYAFVLFISQNRKQLYLSVATITVMVMLCYVWPFLSKNPTIFYEGYKSYDNAAYYEWAKNLRGPDLPWNIFNGTGSAYFFYTRFTHSDMMQRIKLIQKVHLVCSIGITIILGIWYWRNKEKISFKIFLLASFKIYLAVFLFFIQVPYEYLMCLGNFVSIAIFCEQARYKLTDKIAGERQPVI